MSENQGSKGTILVAGEKEATRGVLAQMLRVNGYRVVEAHDELGAFEAICSLRFDIALLDVMMPGGASFSVCRRAKAQPETRLMPVVLVTSLSSADDRMRGIEAGADDFLCKPLRKEELLARVRSLVRLKRFTDELDNAETVLCMLARSIEAKDPYTEGHCDRLSRYAAALAEKMGQKQEQCVALRRGGIVHDIGKVAVPEYVLLKPGALDLDERKLMEMHTTLGERICAPLKSFRQVLPIIRSHHEKLNGTGYPDHLKGDQIPLAARILQTVDIYDALTTDRPYRKALSDEGAFAVMYQEAARGWWDVNLIEEFEGMPDRSPQPRCALVA